MTTESSSSGLKVVNGQRANPLATGHLEECLTQADLHGTLYFGYPVIPTVDDAVTVDALLLTREHGVVLFDLPAHVGNLSDDELVARQDDLFAALTKRLWDYKELREGRELIVKVQVVTLLSNARAGGRDRSLVTSGELVEHIAQYPAVSAETLTKLNASIQRMAGIRALQKRAGVTRQQSRGAIMQRIDREIANLDQWQNWAAIETPDSPQRIRGLAGSGKTIVLALKASYLHAQHPDWDIVVSFQTRALYPHLQELIRRFTYEQLGRDPDWTKLRVLHAWGSAREPGLYSLISQKQGVNIRDFAYARDNFGFDHAFEGVCNELLKHHAERPIKPIFDAVLIDEAQDLPRSFFEIVFHATRAPKRITWAYDELQNLGVYRMAPAAELFGTRADGTPNVPSVDGDDRTAHADVVLPICYRNTPWALATAHAIGLGVYRSQGGLVQYFDQPELWTDIGYTVAGGSLEQGHHVVLKRARESAPKYFERELDERDAVTTHVFDDREQEIAWIAQAIHENVSEDELDPGDILVVMANAYSAKSDAAALTVALSALDLTAHIAGVTTSRDMLFEDGSVALSTIYRAKGNEAPMVYVLGSDTCIHDGSSAFGRNVLFTAITRSRAWVRICGSGTQMKVLAKEVARVRQHDYALEFDVPTADQLKRMRRIHRDMSKAQRRKREQLSGYVGKVMLGDIDIADVPEEFRSAVLASINVGGRRVEELDS